MLAIETIHLTKSFKEKTVVNDLNLQIEKDTLFSLLGTNGAGKTTTIKMLAGLLKPNSGDALLEEKSIVHQSNLVKPVINISPQETAVAPNLTVKENLEFMAGIYCINNSKQKIEDLMKKFHLEEVQKQKAKTLSGGWQRKLSIAMALINDPKILFLDEPTLGLDVIARRELWEIIRELKTKITIILTTHYMEEAEALSDKIGIMANGKLLCVGTSEELIEKANAKNFEDAFVSIATGGSL